MSLPEWYEPYKIDSSITVKENLVSLSEYLKDTYGEKTVASNIANLIIELAKEL